MPDWLRKPPEMILTSLFNQESSLEIILAVDSDVWLRTTGYEHGGDQFKLGGTVRVRTWAGGGQQHDTLAALYNLIKSGEENQGGQMTLGATGFVPPAHLEKAKTRYIPCDDEPGNYAELFRFRNGVQGIRTVDQGKSWTGPVVWIAPDRGMPMTGEQKAYETLFPTAFVSRREFDLREVS